MSHGKPYSIALPMPKMSCIYLIREKDDAVEGKISKKACVKKATKTSKGMNN